MVVAVAGAAIWLAGRADGAYMIAQSFNRHPDWLNLADECPNSLLAEKLYEHALEAGRKEGGEKERDCLQKFAQFYQEQGRNDRAEQLLRRALALASADDETYGAVEAAERLGHLLEGEGRGAEALALYLQTCNAAHYKQYFAYRLPIKYYVVHHMPDAEEGFRLQMLEACKGPAFSSEQRQLEISELAELAIERNRPAQASKWLSQLKETDYTLTLWAWCHERNGQLSKADADYRKAIQLIHREIDPESEYQARLQYICFLKRHGRANEVRPHQEFCARVQESYEGWLPVDGSTPRLYGREHWLRESQLPLVSSFCEENRAPARNADLLNGAQFLYGKVVDQEFGFRRTLEQAKTPMQKAWVLQDLCFCLVKKKKTKEAAETLNQLFDLAQAGSNATNQTLRNAIQSAKRPVMNLLLEEGNVTEALKLTGRQGAFYDKSLGADNCMKGLDMGFDGEIYLAHKFYRESIQVCKDALALYEDRKAKKIECSFAMEIVLKCIAVSSVRLGHLQEARGYYQKLVAQGNVLGNGGNVLEDLQEYAKVCRDLGDVQKSTELGKQAEEWKSKCKREGLPLEKTDDAAYGGKS